MAKKREGRVSSEMDIFDDVVLIEQKLHSDGYNEGYFNGQLVGELEGFRLGVERGKAFGQEVGFYDGFSRTMTMLFENEQKSQRLLKALKQMRQKIHKLNCLETNPQNQDLFTTADDLRAKFKQVSAIVNTTPNYGNFSESVDF